jgi:hypothetical protein
MRQMEFNYRQSMPNFKFRFMLLMHSRGSTRAGESVI